MSFQEIINKIKPKIEETLSGFRQALLEIRAGRAAPSLIEEIKVECFGSILPIKQLGAISAAGKEIIIQLWDRSYAEAAVKAIEERRMGLGVKVSGAVIYLSAPPLSEESKKILIKSLNDKKEESFQELRRLRDKIWKDLQDAKHQGIISEDDKFRGKEKMEEMIKNCREDIEKIAENKEQEILH